MESLIAIFNQLGVDGSIFYQFALFFVLYFVVRSLLFKPLQDVIETREGKTTKLEGEANHKFEKAKKLETEYKEKIDSAYLEAQEVFHAKKTEVIQRERNKYKDAEAKITAEFEEKRREELSKIEAQRAEILSEAKNLSSDLVQKLTN